MKQKKKKCLVVFGTRPEAIKMAPLVLELKRWPDLETVLCVTAQHREMLDQVLNLFDLVPDHDLDIMQPGQTLTGITCRAITGLEKVLEEERPDMVFVHGDTTTTFAGALAAFYRQVPVGHVEAGLRTGQKYAPYPEEINRRLTGVLTDLHFAPTTTARRNLLAEGVDKDTVFITGNTVIDALKYTVKPDYKFSVPELNKLPGDVPLLLVEAHRRENLGEPMERICRALKKILGRHPEVHLVFPVHKNPVVRETVFRQLSGLDRVHLLEPLDVADFHNLMHKCRFILTDSGGVQEEAPSLGRPVLVLRDVTERPEAVEAGTVLLVGTGEERIAEAACRLLENPADYNRMATAVNPYGDGFAARRTVAAVRWYFGLKKDRPADFSPRGTKE